MWKNVSESKLFLDQIFEIKADSPQSHTASRLVSVCSIKARWIRPGYKRKDSLFLSPFNSQPPHFPPAVHRTIQHAYTQTHTCHQCKHFSSKANTHLYEKVKTKIIACLLSFMFSMHFLPLMALPVWAKSDDKHNKVGSSGVPVQYQALMCRWKFYLNSFAETAL